MNALERGARTAAQMFASSPTFAIAFNQRLRERLDELEGEMPRDEDTIANLRVHLGLSVGKPGAPSPVSARRKQKRKTKKPNHRKGHLKRTLTREDMSRTLAAYGAFNSAGKILDGDDEETLRHLRKLRRKLKDERGDAVERVIRNLKELRAKETRSARTRSRR